MGEIAQSKSRIASDLKTRDSNRWRPCNLKLRFETRDWRFVLNILIQQNCKKSCDLSPRSKIASDWRLAILLIIFCHGVSEAVFRSARRVCKSAARTYFLLNLTRRSKDRCALLLLPCMSLKLTWPIEQRPPWLLQERGESAIGTYREVLCTEVLRTVALTALLRDRSPLRRRLLPETPCTSASDTIGWHSLKTCPSFLEILGSITHPESLCQNSICCGGGYILSCSGKCLEVTFNGTQILKEYPSTFMIPDLLYAEYHDEVPDRLHASYVDPHCRPEKEVSVWNISCNWWPDKHRDDCQQSLYPPSWGLLTSPLHAKLAYTINFWGTIYGVIATDSRNQLCKRTLWELFLWSYESFA